MRINRAEFAAALVRKNLTCLELAAATGLSRSTVTNVKTGKSCSKDTAEKLAVVLGNRILAKEGSA